MDAKQLFELVESYRTAGGREEHWAKKEALQIYLEELSDDAARYRYLREYKFKHNGECFALTGTPLWEEDLDYAIDKVRK